MVTVSDKESSAYDDWIVIEPKEHTEILPGNVDLTSYLTRKIKLRLPIASSPMDTVTEHKMAIEMALYGGIGIIHRNFTVDEQVKQIEKVKRYKSGIVEEPYVIGPKSTLADLQRLMSESGKSRFPVTHNGTTHGKLIGIITDKDADFHDPSDPVKKHMTTKDLITTPVGTTLDEAKKIIIEEKKDLLPIVDRKGYLRAVVTRSDIKKSRDYPYASKDSKERLLVGAAISVKDALEGKSNRLEGLVNVGADVIVVDASVGQSKNVYNAIKAIKKDYEIEVVGGNVVSRYGIEYLAKADADGVRVGRGVGQSCITSKVVGIGRGQATAVMECAKIAEEYGLPIIADGSIKYPGHASLAIAMGASTIMMGGTLAGTEEAPDPPGYKRQKKGDVWYKLYRGMGSSSAYERGREVSYGRYAQDKHVGNIEYAPEGVDIEMPITGKVSQVLDQFRSGISNAMSATGARTIREFQNKAILEKVSHIAAREAYPAYRPVHDEPNFQVNR